jgi:hypothetical protein
MARGGGSAHAPADQSIFWLIDHYVNAGEDASRIDETLLKIKILDRASTNGILIEGRVAMDAPLYYAPR